MHEVDASEVKALARTNGLDVVRVHEAGDQMGRGRGLKDKPVADPTLLDQGVFAGKGGFKWISQELNSTLDDVLLQLNEAIWAPFAA